jgi:uncharacterized protein (TIGR02172 family)
MENQNRGGVPVVRLSGRIDSGNAAETEQAVFARLAGTGATGADLDACDLDYISSAGLRMILRLKKNYPDLRILNVKPEVYEVFDMTGFAEMMPVEKAYRVVSVEGCEVIGEGFNGKVYRIDSDNVVKVYKNSNALPEIQHEREVARLALVLGVPTAISYDVVRVGDSYGSVFELLNSRSFAKLLANEPDRYGFCVDEYVKMLKKIHSIRVPEGRLPSKKEKMLKIVDSVKDLIPGGLGDKLAEMTSRIPDSDRMIHGDFHTKNIVLAGDEVLTIDMDTLSVGHPILELVHMYNAYIGYYENDRDAVLAFQGYGPDIADRFWHDSLAAYLGTSDEARMREIEDKVRCLSYAYLIDWGRRHFPDDAKSAQTIGVWMSGLVEVLGRVDSLDFDTEPDTAPDPNEAEFDAVAENLDAVTEFVNSRLSAAGCPARSVMQIDIAVEEVFVNIARYAYPQGRGTALVRVEIDGEPPLARITFRDRGTPYNPLEREDPDVTLSAEDREIGGLGIFMTKKISDNVSYEYRNGQNVLTLEKLL